MTLSRRHVLAGGIAAGATTIAISPASAAPLLTAAGPVRTSPFALGIASGDPTPTGVVLWTRLAVDPLAPDGKGGMPSRDITVQWEVADNDRMHRPVARGAVRARTADAHSVHVEVEGLRSGREYWYRFRVDGHLSPVGRTRTAPRRDEMPATLAMSAAAAPTGRPASSPPTATSPTTSRTWCCTWATTSTRARAPPTRPHRGSTQAARP